MQERSVRPRPAAAVTAVVPAGVILARGDERTGIGVGGAKSHRVVRDVFSGAILLQRGASQRMPRTSPFRGP